jgi:hypothetical protein
MRWHYTDKDERNIRSTSRFRKREGTEKIMNKVIQYFSEEYLERCQGATPDQILEFLENYRMLLSNTLEKSQLISRKRADALRAFPEFEFFEK